VIETAPPPRYRVVLPPGFLLFPVRDKTDDEIAEMVRAHYRGLPRDTFGPRIERVADQILGAVRTARDARVLDLIVPMGVPWRAPVSLGIALSVAAPDAGATWEGLEGERVETDAGAAVRRRDRYEPSDDPEQIMPLARSRFAWRIPGDRDRLLAGVCTVSGASDPELLPLVDALVELGELMLQTIRWEDPPREEPHS
jgi:hypothetical protein